MAYGQQYLERLYDIYGWNAPRYHVGHSVMMPFGAAPNDSQTCMSCYDSKTAAYAGCRSLPVGGARNQCFRLADVALDGCLKTGQCATAGGGIAAAALIAGGLWLAFG